MLINEKYKSTTVFLLISIIAIFYFGGIVTPYAQIHNFLSEAGAPHKKFVPIYVLLTLPFYIAYIVYIIKVLKMLKLRFLCYPIINFNLYAGLFYCLCAFGGSVIWFAIFTFVVFIIVEIILFISGLIFDVLEVKRNKKINN